MRFTVAVLIAASGCATLRVPPQAIHYNDECVKAMVGNDLRQAEALCLHSLEYHPDYWDALNNMGLILKMRGDNPGARGYFIRAIRSNPNMAQSFVNLGVIENEVRAFEKAMRYFRSALKVNPDMLEARWGLAQACVGFSDLECAELAYRQFVASAPMNSDGFVGLGAVLLKKQRTAEALAAFERATELNVGLPSAWLGLGAARQALGRRAEAEEAFEACLEADPKNVDCERELALLRD